MPLLSLLCVFVCFCLLQCSKGDYFLLLIDALAHCIVAGFSPFVTICFEKKKEKKEEFENKVFFLSFFLSLMKEGRSNFLKWEGSIHNKDSFLVVGVRIWCPFV